MGNRVETFKLSEEVVHQAAAEDATAKAPKSKFTFLGPLPPTHPPTHRV